MSNTTIDEVVEDLEKFVYWLAGKKASDSTIMMHEDEIAGELFLELVKGYQHYQGKDLSKPEMLAVIRRMMDNRISELVYKYFKTHRGDGIDYIPVDVLIDRSDPDADGGVSRSGSNIDGLVIKTEVIIRAHISVSANPEMLYESDSRVSATYDKLSFNGRRVLSAILDGNELLQLNLKLVGDRASHVFKNGGSVKVKPWHVADSLGMDVSDVKAAFSEIKVAYFEVCNE